MSVKIIFREKLSLKLMKLFKLSRTADQLANGIQIFLAVSPSKRVRGLTVHLQPSNAALKMLASIFRLENVLKIISRRIQNQKYCVERTILTDLLQNLLGIQKKVNLSLINPYFKLSKRDFLSQYELRVINLPEIRRQIIEFLLKVLMYNLEEYKRTSEACRTASFKK